MALDIIGFIVVFLLILGSGMPVGYGMGVLALGVMSVYMDFDSAMAMGMEKAYASLDSDVLVAIPLFIFAAQLISATGMGKRLFEVGKAFMGRYRAGLGVATIGSSGFFAAMTGSSFVAASTMGLIAIPELRRAKYSDSMISAAISAGGTLGSVIPPSIIMIIYGYLTNESIAKLFMAGLIPGFLLMALYSIALIILTRKIPSAADTDKTGAFRETDTDEAASPNVSAPADAIPAQMTKWAALKDAFWGLMAPVIILGGIYLGVFTANEAAAVAVVYCIFIGMFVYRTLTLKSLWDVTKSSTTLAGMVALIIIGGNMIAQGVSYGRVPQQLLEMIVAQGLGPNFLLFIIIVILFVLGMFMDSAAMMYLTLPVLYPIVLHCGWNNLWFAVIVLINVNIGLITPPMGGVLYTVSLIGDIPLQTVVKGAIMPILILFLVMVMIIFYPSIVTWLPSLM